jgi:hypothetical protein
MECTLQCAHSELGKAPPKVAGSRELSGEDFGSCSTLDTVCAASVGSVWGPDLWRLFEAMAKWSSVDVLVLPQ